MPQGGDRMSKKILILSCTYNNSKDYHRSNFFQKFIAAVRKMITFERQLTNYSQLT